MLDLKENNNSSRKATKSTDLPLKSGLNSSSDEEMRENRDSTISTLPTQSSRDSSTTSISDNSTPRKSISGIMADTPTTFSVETDATEELSSNNRSVMPTDVQALTVLQGLISPVIYFRNAPFKAVALQSSQRLPQTAFYMKKSYRILQLQFYKGTHTHTSYTNPENSPSRIQYYIQRAKRPLFQRKKFYT